MGRLARRLGPMLVGLLAVVVLTAATTRAASAVALIHVDRACYIRTGPQPPRMTLTGSGFTPGGQVTVTDSSGTLQQTLTADATGAVAGTFAGPAKVLTAPGQVRDTIIATEAGTPAITAQTATRISIIAAGHGATASQRGLKALREPTRWVFSGWPHTSIYVHYLRHGRAVARQRFGPPHGPCGTLTVRRPLFPSTPHAAGYLAQVDTHARYSVHTRPRTLLKVGLRLRF